MWPFLGAGDKDSQTLYNNGAMVGEDPLVNMDSILMSLAVWGIRVQQYVISHGGRCSALHSTATLYCTLSDWGCSARSGVVGGAGGERNHEGQCRCLNVQGRVVHSDPAATIKIGGVRCLHSSLCKSHQPEPFFIPRGWLHHQ